MNKTPDSFNFKKELNLLIRAKHTLDELKRLEPENQAFMRAIDQLEREYFKVMTKRKERVTKPLLERMKRLNSPSYWRD